MSGDSYSLYELAAITYTDYIAARMFRILYAHRSQHSLSQPHTSVL